MDQPQTDTDARIAELLGQILERVDVIDRRQVALEARLDALDAIDETTSPPQTEPSQTLDPAPIAPEANTAPLSRRKLLTGAVGVTAAGVAVIAGASPAAATNGQPILAAQNNTATATTTISASGSATAALDAINSNSSGAGVYAQTGGSSGLSSLGALIGDSVNASGVVGLSNFGSGVYGSSTAVAGVQGEGEYVGVLGFSPRVAVRAVSTEGVALAASSEHVQIAFQTISRTAPTGDAGPHFEGEMVFDANGDLWFCVGTGAPGTWRRISGSTSAGSFHVLPAPARIYDSRPGSLPAVGSKTKLTNTPRTLSCNVNSSGVPIGATAVALTVLLVNAANGDGNMTVWANGAARPASNTMVWGAGSGRYTSSTISAVDAQARIQVAASAATNLVLDVVGYYR